METFWCGGKTGKQPLSWCVTSSGNCAEKAKKLAEVQGGSLKREGHMPETVLKPSLLRCTPDAPEDLLRLYQSSGAFLFKNQRFLEGFLGY
jgi:hypothetical protein